jgi:Sulfotransferase domain
LADVRVLGCEVVGVLDFFVVGVQKGGTTALAYCLSRHPEIRLAVGKELHVFDDDSQDWSHPDYSRIAAAFDSNAATGKLLGEATPSYCFWPDSLRRLQHYNPAAKLILLLRHPVFRAHSHWRMEVARGTERLPFALAVADSTSTVRRAADPALAQRLFSYLERGFYSPQIQQILSLFPREQILFLRTDAFWNDCAGTLARVAGFLGIEGFPSVQRRYIVPGRTEASAPLPAQDRRLLEARYADDIRHTESLTGLHLTDWLDPGYLEPMVRGSRWAPVHAGESAQ